LLARAFDDDPFFRWLLPIDESRRRWLGYIMRTMIEQSPSDCVFAWDRDGALAGVLGAVSPNAWPIPFSTRARAYVRAGLLPWPTARVVIGGLRAQSAIDRAHPPAPHWYVQAIGVDPAHQGNGGGRELLGHVVEQASVEGVPAYLETGKPENRAYYQRFGFEVVSELVTSPGAPPLWTMLRP
jgi:ribosomal protein S18 acetylase RimI-like enzyme